jgi:hypothetical protein
MKILKTLSLSILLSGAFVSSSLVANENMLHVYFSETPAKTICIKNSAASNTDTYFASTTVISFEVYKAGSAEDVAKIIKTLKKDGAVESCVEGALTGDYQAITLTLKSAKNKAWFVNQFKKAGLNTIKINNNPIVEVDKM